MTRVTPKPLSLYLRKRAQKLARAHARPAEETFTPDVDFARTLLAADIEGSAIDVQESLDWSRQYLRYLAPTAADLSAEQRVISVYRMGRETASDTQYWLAMPITVDFTATLSAGDAERTYDVTLPALDGGAK